MSFEACRSALVERRLFYCRPIHGVFALAAFFGFPDHEVLALLGEKLQISRFGSALAHFREPWFAKYKPRAVRNPYTLWGAAGPAGACARAWLDVAYHPIDLEDNPKDDYRDKDEREAQLACFVRSEQDMARLAANYANDAEMFTALEAADISDLFRDLLLCVSRSDGEGEVGFSELSDGERQLLMVLGLTRISRGKRGLFLLDEPDTHLNPAWQLDYLKLIEKWTGEDEEADNCQSILTSHNPLTPYLPPDPRCVVHDIGRRCRRRIQTRNVPGPQSASWRTRSGGSEERGAILQREGAAATRSAGHRNTRNYRLR